jgi:tight adherence protein B
MTGQRIRPGPSVTALIALPRVIASLRSGAPPELAWEEWPEAELDVDGRVSLPGDPDLSAALSATARMARTTGAPLGDLLTAVEGVLRDEDEAALRRGAALAGPRASATVLSWLPVVGVAMGALVEPASLRLLFGSVLGWVLVLAASALWWAGRRWMGALVARAAAAGRPR